MPLLRQALPAHCMMQRSTAGRSTAQRTMPQQVVVVNQVLVRPLLLLHAQLHRALQHADHVLQVLLRSGDVGGRT